MNYQEYLDKIASETDGPATRAQRFRNYANSTKGKEALGHISGGELLWGGVGAGLGALGGWHLSNLFHKDPSLAIKLLYAAGGGAAGAGASQAILSNVESEHGLSLKDTMRLYSGMARDGILEAGSSPAKNSSSASTAALTGVTPKEELDPNASADEYKPITAEQRALFTEAGIAPSAMPPNKKAADDLIAEAGGKDNFVSSMLNATPPGVLSGGAGVLTSLMLKGRGPMSLRVPDHATATDRVRTQFNNWTPPRGTAHTVDEFINASRRSGGLGGNGNPYGYALRRQQQNRITLADKRTLGAKFRTGAANAAIYALLAGIGEYFGRQWNNRRADELKAAISNIK